MSEPCPCGDSHDRLPCCGVPDTDCGRANGDFSHYLRHVRSCQRMSDHRRVMQLTDPPKVACICGESWPCEGAGMSDALDRVFLGGTYDALWCARCGAFSLGPWPVAVATMHNCEEEGAGQ